MRSSDTEQQFQRYAPLIATVVQAWPAITEFAPTSISVVTFQAGIRSAIRAKQKYGYRNIAINDTIFNNIAHLIAVGVKDNKVVIGPRSEVRKRKQATPAVLSNNNDNEIVISSNHIMLERLAYLLHNRAFTPTPTFIINNPDSDTLGYIKGKYDVSITELSPNKYQIA